MSADTRPRLKETISQKRSSFREWRGQRPFWGGMLTLFAGIPIMYIPYQNLTLGSLTIRMSTTAGAGSLIIGVLLVVLGLTMWFQPTSRVFAGVAAILLALVSLVVSNVGAFLLGFLPGLIGGALGIAWAPGRPAARGPGEAGSPDGGSGARRSANDAEEKGGSAAGAAADDTAGEDAAQDDADAAKGANDPGTGSREDPALFGAASPSGAPNHGNGRHRAG
ncbi:hypothetical protein E0L36_12250 [Streptomyces sp. AJS327]|uniref:DUF6114 domain-containing protein n=1 Tax=Streptomyces sp. AJS327 TaxID=2545265 RepID=UPI0015DF68CC|nr:DUF6114 domain-containing protein [Streptomyces sp. AJS327]MBA0051637.1 hypothetical protein [Streptomyces sp. AJS327]